MGYLDNTTVTVDAILTNKGRQVLAMGGQLNITKFALADDEVDYDLWNPAHSLGTNYYGSVIENMPILEASPDETQMLRYKLVTLPKTAIGIPVIKILPSGPITFTRMADAATITVTTSNYAGGNSTLGYTAILSDSTVATLEPAPDSVLGMAAPTATSTARMVSTTPNTVDTQATFSNFLDDETGSITTSGNTITRTSSGKFMIKPQSVIGTKSALLTIIANETGGFQTIVITSTNTVNETSVDVSTTQSA
jgi:hypothetical protein